ncbi:MAG TPA: SDR family NAD(P)-dependent oxidoreductase [Paracoccus sp. (in: a-proteobacteria)]|nr:SDR family NAD(P)-dependent oxidoreductase [Paracoccus sp. (in: a-proteobacteria)]
MGFGPLLLLASLEAGGLRPDHIVHLWMLDAQAARAGTTALDSTLARGFYGLMHLAQAIGAELGDHPLTLTAATEGAQKVATESVPAPEAATVAGPLLVIPRELPNVAVRWIDLRLDPPARRGARADHAAVAARLAEEICVPPERGTTEVVAWRDGRRFRQALLPVALWPVEQPAIGADDVCLITGGFGGVAQTLARGLAARGARLVLMGRGADRATGQRGRRQRAAIAALEAMGAGVLAVGADLTDPDSVAAGIAAARARFGRIDVVLHAAGVIDDTLMAVKQDAAAADVLAPKLYGTLNLMQALADQPPRLTVLFSSSSTALGAAGQVDYVAANAWLDALGAAQPAALGRVVTVNWGVWAETGMAARATGSHVVEPVDPARAPLLTGEGPDGFVAELSPGHWLIDGHRTETGQALLPGTGIIELMVEALAAAGQALPVTLRDLSFMRPVLAGNTEAARVTVRLGDDGTVTLDDGQDDSPNATARIETAELRPLASLHVGAVWQREDPAGLRSAQEGRMRFGPEWRVLRALRLDGDVGLARLALDPAFAGDADRMWLHPALLDIATGWAMDLIPGYDPAHLWVPMSYARISVFGRLPARILSRVQLLDSTGETARLAVTLTDADGRPVVDIDGFTLRRMAEGLPAAHPRSRLSPAEERLRHTTRQGIRAADGLPALDRALAAALKGGLGQVHVSTLDLPSLVAQAGPQDQDAAAGGQAFERPDIDGTFVAPEPGTQAELAGIWAGLLGIRQIGAEDSFFDLGGHSLIAVRMFTQVRKHYGVDFPISALFEAPTVAALAARIDARTGRTNAAHEAAPGAAPAPQAQDYRFVVDMGGREGSGLPFFVVAGMFGNVMNLRALAQRIGRDRRVYGLQARGLFGGDSPHEDFAEAARDYLAEIRQVQPRGPWLLGGFSGGGLIALEMARQLAEAGETVGQLILLDTPLPLRPELSRRDRLAIRWAEMREQGLSFAGNWLRARRAYRQSLNDRAAAAEADATQFHDLAIEAAFRAALPKVRLSVWDGPAALFRPALDRRWRVSGSRWVSEAREYVIPDNGWSDWMPQLKVVEVPGDHDSMVLEPSVRVLAARLSDLLQAADGAADAADETFIAEAAE